jgi:hypothetical protein
MFSQETGYHIVGAHSNALRPGKIAAGEGTTIISARIGLSKLLQQKDMLHIQYNLVV